MKRLRKLVLIYIVVLLTSCYYDNQQEIHPGNGVNCDTTITTYSAKVTNILQSNNCYSCHTGSAASGGINLDTYNGVQAVAADGRLVGAITKAAGFRPMPPSGSMSPCDIAIIKSWVTKGAVNN